MNTIDFRAALGRYRYVLLALGCSVLFVVIAVSIVSSIEYHNKDFFTYWLAGRLAVMGQDPYRSDVWIAGHHQFGSTWIPNATFVYPLPVSLLFAPFGLLPLFQAFILWVTLTEFMIAASVRVLLRAARNVQAPRYILPIVAGIVLFRPTALTLINGQMTGFLLLVLACVVLLWERARWWQGAALLPLLGLKPNLGVPIILLLLFYLLLQKRMAALLGAAVSAVTLLLLGLIQNPTWIIEFWRAGNTKLSQTFGFSPTIWGVSTLLCNYNLNCAIGYGAGIGLITLLGYAVFLTRKSRLPAPTMVVGLALSVALLLTPYTWPYDQLLLVIPIVAVTLGLAEAGHRFMPSALIFLAFDLMAMILLYVSARIQMEIWNAAIPLSVLGLLAWYLTAVRPAHRVTGTT